MFKITGKTKKICSRWDFNGTRTDTIYELRKYRDCVCDLINTKIITYENGTINEIEGNVGTSDEYPQDSCKCKIPSCKSDFQDAKSTAEKYFQRFEDQMKYNKQVPRYNCP